MAAKQLFDALRACEIDPNKQLYDNLFTQGDMHRFIRKLKRTKRIVVAMGKKVGNFFDKNSIHHIKLIHPAARGNIRKKENYIAHVRERLALDGKSHN